MRSTLAILAVLATGCSPSLDAPKVTTTAVAAPKVRVEKPRVLDSIELCELLRKADESLLEKPIQLDGIVEQVGMDKEGDPYIRLLTSREWELRTYAARDVDVNAFKSGQRVTAEGQLRDRIGSSINVVDCRIRLTPNDAEKHGASALGASVEEILEWYAADPERTKRKKVPQDDFVKFTVHGVVVKASLDPYGHPTCQLRSPSKEEIWCDLSDWMRVRAGDVVIIQCETDGYTTPLGIGFGMSECRSLLRSE